MKQLLKIFGSVLKVLPSLVLLSVVSCLFGRFLFNVPLDQLGAVASVPLVVGFLLTRFLILVMPPGRETHNLRPTGMIMSAIFSMALFSAIVFLCSTVPYAAVGLPKYAAGSLKAAGVLFAISTITLVMGVFSVLWQNLSLFKFFRILATRIAEVFWELLRIPSNLSVKIYGHHLDSV